MVIQVNNNRTLLVHEILGGIRVQTINGNLTLESEAVIFDNDLVMLYDYWLNCKNGTEKSDYIAKAEKGDPNVKFYGIK